MANNKTAITPIRADNFPEWYQQVIKASLLAENSSTRGCMIILPLGQALWENMQRILDREFKRTGSENVYFPLLIPLSLMQKEADHVEGFAKECAVVTHRRLELVDGELQAASPLQEPYVIRPTSELVIGEAFARWVRSYRDLPVVINQWANVMRWEMRPRIFLRTAEFLWQEGHTVHASKKEAHEKTLQMLEVYRAFLQDCLAIPVTAGEKSASERFPGAEETYTVEAMMQDGKALQAGTAHFLGQNFAKAQGIKFLDKDEEEKFAWTTSWGVSTRMIGGLIMTHSDDNGLVLPPRICRHHVAIIPVLRGQEDLAEIMAYIEQIKTDLEAQTYHDVPLNVYIDKSEDRGGEKYWRQVKKGTPLIIEVGPRDFKNQGVFMTKRNLMAKEGLSREDFVQNSTTILDEIQREIFLTAEKKRDDNVTEINTLEEFRKLFKKNNDKMTHPYAYGYVDDNPRTQEILKQHQASIRCYALDELPIEGKTCLFSGEKANRRALIARSY